MNSSMRGITLIALVITIIVLLILAGISISMLSGNNNILNKATAAKEITEQKDIEERIKLVYLAALAEEEGKNVSNTKLSEKLSDEFRTENFELSDDGSTVTINGKEYEIGFNDKMDNEEVITSTIEENKANVGEIATPLSTKNSVIIKDNNDNKVKIPKGFGIASDSGSNVSDGVVIEDVDSTRSTYGSQFVWVPIGTIYTNETKTETKEIAFGRYTFESDGTPKALNENRIY